MTEIEKLILAVETKGVAGVNSELDKMEKNAKETEKAFGGLKASTIAFAAAATAVAGAVYLLGSKLVSATRNYQGFMAQLQTSTGSLENAKIAFQALQDFATTTPYSMAQATESFLLLVNRGLDPSERSLRALGNTASAMNKNILELAQGTAQAVSGEYEILKSFGIGASKAGNDITFSFQGVDTVVKNTAKEIQGFITSIGENKFGDAMALQMKTLNGAISNLEDAWEQLWQNISNLGPGNLLTQGFKAAGDAITELNQQILSGELETRLNAQIVLWQQWADAAKTSASAIGYVLSEAGKGWGGIFGLVEKDFKEIFSAKFPAYAYAGVQIVTAYFVKLWANMKTSMSGFVAFWGVQFDRMTATAIEAGKRVAMAMTGNIPGAVSGAKEAFDTITTESDKKTQAVIDNTIKETAANEDVFAETVKLINGEQALILSAYDAEIEKAERLRHAHEAGAEARRLDGPVLGQFGKGGGSTLADKGAKGAADKALAEAQRAFEEQLKLLESSLEVEGMAIDTAYEARKEAILNNTKTTEEEKKNLILTALADSLITEEQAITNSYNARKEFILSATGVTEEAKTELMKRLTAARDEQIKKMEDKTMKSRLDSTAEFFGNIASIGSTFGKEAFEVAKIAAIAQATIKTFEAAQSAYAAGALLGGPVVGGLYAAAAVAAGVANIAQIKAQQFSAPASSGGGTKAYALGGMIPAGRYGLVGEAGPEIVRGPAVVTSAAATASHGRGSSNVRTVTIQNHGQPLQAETSLNGDDLEIRLRPILAKHKAQVKDEMTNEIERGGGGFGRTLERNYGLRREGR